MLISHDPPNREEKCPLVSVIMSAYNAENTIGQAITSIFNQSFKDFEFIICDDASTDGTWRVLTSWTSIDPRIILLQNADNCGAGPARNRCIKRARGKYIAFMDADDISMPGRLAEQVDTLDRFQNIDFVGTKGEFFSEEPGDMGEYYWFCRAPEKRDFLMTLPFVHASLMVRAEVLNHLDGYSESPGVRRSEDYDLLMRAYAAGYRGVNLQMPLYGIRLNQETYLRRKYRYRFHECRVKWAGFSQLGLMPEGIPYALKPLVVGLIPIRLLNILKKRYYSTVEE